MNDERRSTLRVVVAVVALALGGFAIGTTEFVTMGVLPDIAAGVGVDIPPAGHVISVYALGVVVGAPVIAALSARLPRRALLVALMAAFLVGNALTALAPGYRTLLVARFLSGLPHGAYFGVASLVAASLVAPHLRGRAVSSVLLGLAAAMLTGVPAATWLGQQLGWRSAYWLVVVLAAITVAAVLAVVPSSPGRSEATVRGELGALRRPQVILTLLVGVVGFGGMFALYSYIAPVVTDVAGLARGTVPWVLLAYGAGGVVGTALGGRLADWALFRSLVGHPGLAAGAARAGGPDLPLGAGAVRRRLPGLDRGVVARHLPADAADGDRRGGPDAGRRAQPLGAEPRQRARRLARRARHRRRPGLPGAQRRRRRPGRGGADPAGRLGTAAPPAARRPLRFRHREHPRGSPPPPDGCNAGATLPAAPIPGSARNSAVSGRRWAFRTLRSWAAPG